MGDTLRACIKCGRELPEDGFYKRLDHRNRNICKECTIKRVKYTKNCKVDLNTTSLCHYFEELSMMCRLFNAEEFRGDLSVELLGIKLHHKAIKHGALILVERGSSSKLHDQWFKLSTPCIDWLLNKPVCSKSLKK